jgi:hypothetical protein
MSDGAPNRLDFAEPVGNSAYEPRTRKATELDLAAFVEWLPRLGSVPWLHRQKRENAFPRARLTGRGVLLLEHPDIAASPMRPRSALDRR